LDSSEVLAFETDPMDLLAAVSFYPMGDCGLRLLFNLVNLNLFDGFSPIARISDGGSHAPFAMFVTLSSKRRQNAPRSNETQPYSVGCS